MPGIHAREWISPATVTYVMNELITNPQHGSLLNMFDFFILPVTTPDGSVLCCRYLRYIVLNTRYRLILIPNRRPSHFIIFFSYEYSHTVDRLWRKNRNPNPSTFGLCSGVDLNRNFGYKWGHEV